LDNGVALLPKTVSDSVSIENVQGILDSKDFELWHEYISAEDRKALAQVRIALVNRFTSSGHMGEEEKRSEDLLHRYFVCLRIIKPTRSRYQAIQFKQLENGIDVFHVSGPHPTPLNLPDAEILNDINNVDVTQLIQRIESFLAVEANGPFRVRRAIRLYETGYSEIRD